MCLHGMYICLGIRIFKCTHTNTNTYIHTRTHTHTHIYIYIYYQEGIHNDIRCKCITVFNNNYRKLSTATAVLFSLNNHKGTTGIYMFGVSEQWRQEQ